MPTNQDISTFQPAVVDLVLKEGVMKAREANQNDFYCTTIDSALGDITLLRAAMDVMNAEAGMGAVAKLLISSGDDTSVTMVSYVPSSKRSELDAKTWLTHVANSIGAKIHISDAGYGYAILTSNSTGPDFNSQAEQLALREAHQILRDRGILGEHPPLGKSSFPEDREFSFDIIDQNLDDGTTVHYTKYRMKGLAKGEFRDDDDINFQWSSAEFDTEDEITTTGSSDAHKKSNEARRINYLRTKSGNVVSPSNMNPSLATHARPVRKTRPKPTRKGSPHPMKGLRKGEFADGDEVEPHSQLFGNDDLASEPESNHGFNANINAGMPKTTFKNAKVNPTHGLRRGEFADDDEVNVQQHDVLGNDDLASNPEEQEMGPMHLKKGVRYNTSSDWDPSSVNPKVLTSMLSHELTCDSF
jgi:hypothetical protein